MKKNILFSIAFLFSFGSFAQQIQYGIAGGVSSYGIRGEAIGNLEQVINYTNGIVRTVPVNGFYFGGHATIPLGDILSVEPGLYYATKGYAMKGSFTFKGISLLGANAKAALHSSYIEMPILLKANFNGFQVFAGPQIAYLSGARIKTTAGILGFNLPTGSINVTDQLNRWDAAITAGIGYQFANGIRFTGSYDRGLSKIDAGQNINSYNQGFKIGAGINF